MKCFKKTHGNLWILKSNEIIFCRTVAKNIYTAIPDSAFSMMDTQIESFALKMTDMPWYCNREKFGCETLYNMCFAIDINTKIFQDQLGNILIVTIFYIQTFMPGVKQACLQRVTAARLSSRLSYRICWALILYWRLS